MSKLHLKLEYKVLKRSLLLGYLILHQ